MVRIPLTDDFLALWNKNGPLMIWLKEFVGQPMINWTARIENDSSNLIVVFEFLSPDIAMAFKIRWGYLV